MGKRLYGDARDHKKRRRREHNQRSDWRSRNNTDIRLRFSTTDDLDTQTPSQPPQDPAPKNSLESCIWNQKRVLDAIISKRNRGGETTQLDLDLANLKAKEQRIRAQMAVDAETAATLSKRLLVLESRAQNLRMLALDGYDDDLLAVVLRQFAKTQEEIARVQKKLLAVMKAS